MAKKIYIGNLSFITTEETLRDLFAVYGEVSSVTIIKDKVTEQSKGFGFVEMPEDDQALKAISVLAGKELDGRRIRVSEAEERRQNTGNGEGFHRNGGSQGRQNGRFRGGRNGGKRNFRPSDSNSNEY